MTEGKQECRLCDGSGICPFNTYARCVRCDGKRELDASVDQSKPIMTTMRCGTCGEVHEGPDTLYVLPCPNKPKSPTQRMAEKGYSPRRPTYRSLPDDE